MGFKKGPGWEERDDRERDRERRDMAFKLARAMKEKQRKELAKRGLSPEAIKGKLENESVGQLADFLYKMKPKELDKQIAKEKEALGQAARKSKKSLGNIGRRTASEINHIGSKFKGYLQGKRDIRNRERERNDSTNEPKDKPRKERAPRKDSSSKRKRPEHREGKEKQNRSDSQSPISVKDLFKDVRQIQREKPPRLGEFQSRQEFDKARENYHDLESKKSFEKQFDESKQYFEDKLKGKETPKPALVKQIEDRERRRLHEDLHGGPPEVKIESMQDVDKLLTEYPEKRKHSNFEEQYRRSKVYFEVRDDWSKMEKELAREHDVSESTIGNYRRKHEPVLVSNLRKIEENRIVSEWSDTIPIENLPRDVKYHQIEQKNLEITPQVHNIDHELVIRHFNQEIGKIGAENVTDSIGDVIRDVSDTDSKVMVLDLQQSELHPKQLKELEKVVRINNREISESLSTQIEKYEDVRIGFVQDKLYVWTPTLNKDCMIDAWKGQYFHFQSNELSKLVNETGTQLNLGNTQYEKLKNFNDLMQQMNPDTHFDIKIKDSFNHQNPRISGEVVRFKRDSLGLSAKDFTGRVTKVAGKNGVGGIENPRFLHDSELEIERARLYSIIKSDGWVNRYRTVGYAETDVTRFDIVERNLQAWGDIELGRYYDSSRQIYQTRFPSPFWEALHYWGFPLGDKMMYNEGVGLDVENLSIEATRVYLGELIPEDGCFSSNGFEWSRSVVLDAGLKSEEYRFKSLLKSELTSFIEEYGTHDEEKQRKILRVSRLAELTTDSDPLISAKAQDLEQIIRANPSQLIEDEMRMAQRIGLETNLNPTVVRSSLRTGRVSVYWRALTAGVENKEMWAIACPPNDVRKCQQVKTWLKKRDTTLDDAQKKLRNNRIPFDEWWK